MDTLLGIDIGTTAAKTSLFRLDGRLVGAHSAGYPVLSPQEGYAEQDPGRWWQAVVEGCRSLQAEHPAELAATAGVGICGQMHTQVYLDRDRRVLRPAILWMDQRSAPIVEALQGRAEARELVFRESGNAATTTYTAPQVRWVMEHEPELWRTVQTVLVAKDYLKLLLTGRAVMDYSEASGTLLFDVARRKWSEELFRLFGIPRSRFPEALPSGELIGRVTPQAARATGIRAGTPVVNGSSDNSASALGAGMVHPGQATLIVGTAGVVSLCSDRPVPDPLRRTLCWSYCLPDRWVLLGITQTAGESLDWFRAAFDRTGGQGGPDPFARYEAEAGKVPPGSEGLIFLPYLNGERTPYWDPRARGVFYGVGLSMRKGHFVRAIMEGVSYALRNNVETLESLGLPIARITAVGGGLRSRRWLEILAGILNRPLSTAAQADTANLGNILLCGNALGIYPSLEEEAARMAGPGEAVAVPEGTGIYEDRYRLFLELYERLRDTFGRSASAERPTSNEKR